MFILRRCLLKCLGEVHHISKLLSSSSADVHTVNNRQMLPIGRVFFDL